MSENNKNPWRTEELSILILCPTCGGLRLKHVEAAGVSGPDDMSRLYHCPECQKNWWIFIRVVNGLPVLIANAP